MKVQILSIFLALILFVGLSAGTALAESEKHDKREKFMHIV